MKIIVGLGNPGPKYELTRHNVGFLAIDRLVDDWGASGPTQQFQGQIYQGNFQEERVCLVKPQTYMNLSGRCVGALVHFYRCEPSDVIVIHDDLDLDPMTVRLKTGGGAGGHNGLKSIDESLGKDRTGYHRVRIGIGHPSRLEDPELKKRSLAPADYVLQVMNDLELKKLDLVLTQTKEAIEAILVGKMQIAMNQLHRKSTR